jgi:alpha-tubulin suppressor-like RCC1 family protein
VTLASATGAGPRRMLRPAVAVAGAAAVIIAAAAAPAAAAPGARGTPAAAAVLAPAGLFAWGSAARGQLGNGVTGGLTSNQVGADTPVSITLPAGARQISSGGLNSAAVLANGTLATWGENVSGEIGDGTTTLRNTPVVVPGLSGITQVAAGFHMLALDSGGQVWSWGTNNSGELGNGTTSQQSGSNPTPVPVPGLSGIVQIAGGQGDSFALQSNGTVWAWGYNVRGQLGDGTTVNRDRPEQIPALFGIKKIVAGYSATYAIRADGSVLAWGDNAEGVLGTGTAGGFSATPAPVPGLAGVTQISASSDTGLAVAGPAGTVWAWGDNIHGQLGDGTTVPHYTPEQIGLSGAAQVGSGEWASAAVLSSGSVLAWGLNVFGNLGTGTDDQNTHPSPVLVRTLAGASQVSAGDGDVLAVASPAPRVPSVIDDTQSQAAHALQAAGYVLGHVGLIVDLTCEYLGVVKTQSPAAGTIDPPGTSVSVGIGKPGGKCL